MSEGLAGLETRDDLTPDRGLLAGLPSILPYSLQHLGSEGSLCPEELISEEA